MLSAWRCAVGDSGPSKGRHSGDQRSRARGPHQVLRGCGSARNSRYSVQSSLVIEDSALRLCTMAQSKKRSASLR